MENDNFYKKSHCELIITSESTLSEEITRQLGINPSRSFKMGDTSKSKHSGSILTKPHHLWALNSKNNVAEEEPLLNHIAYIEEKINGKIETLAQLRKDGRVEISFWIWIVTDDAGVGMEIPSKILLFIAKVCDKVQFSLITKNE